MAVKPLGDKILVKRLEAEDVTKGGIVLPESAKEKPKEGRVQEVGPGKVLTGLARRAFPEVDFVPVGTREDLAGVLEQIEAAS